MATKTKAELEQEIANNHNQIAALKQELEKVNRIENKNQSATELTKILINNATAKRGLF